MHTTTRNRISAWIILIIALMVAGCAIYLGFAVSADFLVLRLIMWAIASVYALLGIYVFVVEHRRAKRQ